MRHCLLVLALLLPTPLLGQDAKAKIAELEKKWKAEPDRFDAGLHNELRHLYRAIDLKESMRHVDIILKHAPMGHPLRPQEGGGRDHRALGQGEPGRSTRCARRRTG